MFELRLPPVDKNIKVTGKSVFALYIVLKTHMEGRYDAILYNFTMNVTNSAYDKRKDKAYFEKFAKKYTFIQLFVLFLSNNIHKENWIGELEHFEQQDNYRNYLGNIRKIKINFKEDIKSIFYFSKTKNIGIKDILYDKDKSYLIRLIRSDVIKIETLLVLDSFLGILDRYNKDDIAWNAIINRYLNYKKLVIIQTEEAKTLFSETVKEIKEAT